MTDLSKIKFQKMDGSETTLEAYQGKVLLIVNVASKCGLTPQYSALENLYRTYKERGLEILAFPANNFKGQEPGTHEEIQEFCRTTYDVTFPLFHKISVVGSDKHPLYAALTELKPESQKKDGTQLEVRLSDLGIKKENPADILWNFEKFLINKNGEVAERFAPDVEPDSPMLRKKLESLL